jgi:hypothetical protein
VILIERVLWALGKYVVGLDSPTSGSEVHIPVVEESCPRLAWSAADHTVVLPDADDVSRDAPGDPAEQKRQAR